MHLHWCPNASIGTVQKTNEEIKSASVKDVEIMISKVSAQIIS